MYKYTSKFKENDNNSNGTKREDIDQEHLPNELV